MDVFVLLIFAGFFAALTVATTANGGLLRASMRRPGLFQAVAVGAGTVLVPLDLSVAAYGTIGGGQARLSDIAAQLLLLNVAASCGIAALHGYLRRLGFAPDGSWTPDDRRALDDDPAMTSGTVPTSGEAMSGSVMTGSAVMTGSPVMTGIRVTSGGSAMEPALRLGVLGWVGPLVALVAVAGMVVLGQLRNHEGAAAVGPVWAFYSVLICVISAYALLRQRARGAIDPQEG
ncbi:hypothetical protein OG394_12505 [Kribbella sp. NBC_01245]|uniref:hypothetical protein n=1 Tax=Kribbella sp. NBC_01245 TaxID=2903578 RepID=UPI002E2CF2C9|nr:hypothetical protein [Kribbella sp. NBC_01245]